MRSDTVTETPYAPTRRPAPLGALLVAALLLAVPATGCAAATQGAGASQEDAAAAPADSDAASEARSAERAARAEAEHSAAGAGEAVSEPASDSGAGTAAADQGRSPAPRRPLPELPADRPLRAAFLVVDGVYNTELMAPYDVFHHTPFHTAPGIEVFTVSPDGEPVVTFEGLTLHPHHSFADAPQADVLVVPSAEGSMDTDLENEEMIAWVKRAGAAARWVVSLCDGAFVLAEAGLLDDHAATTFPADYDAFSRRFPGVDLRINVSFVHDGKMLTSQGGARSYDVAMYLVDLLYGEEVARGVGGGLLIPWPVERTTRGERDLFPPYTVVIDPQAAQ